MTTLFELIKRRKEEYDKHTKSILEEVDFVIEALLDVIEDEISQFIEWKSVDTYENEYLLVQGIIKFPIGYKVHAMGEDIEVDTEIAQKMLQKIINIVIPMELVETRDKEQIKKYLMEQFGEMETETLKKEHKNQNDFSVELSEEQYKQMMWHQEHTSKGKIS